MSSSHSATGSSKWAGLRAWPASWLRSQVVNQGKVAFDFSVDLSHLSRPGIVAAMPMKGTVAAGEKVNIRLKAGCCTPLLLQWLLSAPPALLRTRCA